MSSRITKHVAVSLALPLLMVLIAFITGIKYILGVALVSLIFLGLALQLDVKPEITFEVELEKKQARVFEPVGIKAKVRVKKGVGFLYVNSFPLEGSEEGKNVDLIQGKNSKIFFKGWKGIERTYTYTLKFLVRGEYSVGKISYQYFGLFGNSKVSGVLDLRAVVRVYPKERPVLFNFATIRAVADLPQSITARVGPVSTEFRDIREYQIGDPYRFINWSATSRRNRVMVNEYEREGLKNIIFVFDTGPWMRAGVVEENPLEYGVVYMLSMSRLLLREGFNVGLWSVPGRVEVMPSAGSSQIYRLITASLLLKVTEGEYVPSRSFIRMVYELKPHIVYITNLTEESYSMASSFLCRNGRCLPSRSMILLDIQPFSVISRYRFSSIGINTGCVSWMKGREKIYSKLPKRVRVVSWDPLCSSLGSVMVETAKKMTLEARLVA